MTIILRFLFLLVAFSTFAQDVKLSPLTLESSLKEGADSVVKNESLTLDLSNSNYLTYKVYRVVYVYNKAGNTDVKAYASYDKDRHVKDIQATIYNFLGEKVDTFKKRDFKDVSAVSGGSLYEDSRVLYLDYTPTTYPYTVVFESEIKTSTTAFLPQWSPLSNYGSSTEFSKYEVVYDPSNKLTTKESNFDGYAIEHTQNPGHSIWIARDLKALDKEHMSPAFEDRMPNLKCAVNNFQLEGVSGVANDWEEFGKWMNDNLFFECDDLPETTVAHVKELVKDLPDNRAKAKAIYKYVQDKVRYISVQVGIGGWKPMNASQVDKLSYGDCKALTNYTKNLLTAVEIPSYYTILYAGKNKKSIDQEVVAMQGNHAILGVELDNKITWLECTSQENPFGYLGDFTDDRDVLMITDNGGVFKHTTSYDKENISQVNAQISLSENGIKGKLTRESKGIFYKNGLYLDRLDHSKLIEFYKNSWGHLNLLKIDDVQLNNVKDSIVYQEDLLFSLPEYVTLVDEGLLVKPLIFRNTLDQIPPRHSGRKSTFKVERNKNYQDKLTFAIPENFEVSSVPDKVEINTEFGSYLLEFLINEDNSFSCLRKLSINEGVFQPEQYKDYRNFYKKITRNDNSKILIKKKI